MVAILTSGTLSDPDMLRAQPEAAYVLSLWERPAPPVAPGGPPRSLLGACYTDCASNTLTLGQWCVPRLLRMGVLCAHKFLLFFLLGQNCGRRRTTSRRGFVRKKGMGVTT